MSYQLYDASISVATDVVQSLKDLLKLGEASPQGASLPTATIHEDMKPLTFQVFSVTDIAQKVVARTSGTEPLALEKDLVTYEDMYKRIALVQDLLAKADKDLINSRAGEIVTLGLGVGKTAEMSAGAYVNGYALPNMFFHVVTAYNILRKEGVTLGKMDYLSSFIGKHLPKPQ